MLTRHIVVLGAGAIGTLYAAKLSRDNRVTLVVRRQEEADLIRRQGVRITGIESVAFRLDAVPRLETIESDTLIVLSTKVYDSAEAIGSMRELLRPDTVILCLQNGLHSEQVVRHLVRDRCLVLRGITDFGVIFSGPGAVVLKARGPTLIEASPSVVGWPNCSRAPNSTAASRATSAKTCGGSSLSIV